MRKSFGISIASYLQKVGFRAQALNVSWQSSAEDLSLIAINLNPGGAALASKSGNAWGIEVDSENHAEILTTEEAARFLRVSKNTLDRMRMRNDGTGPPWHNLSPKRVAYIKSEALTWLAAQPGTAMKYNRSKGKAESPE